MPFMAACTIIFETATSTPLIGLLVQLTVLILQSTARTISVEPWERRLFCQVHITAGTRHSSFCRMRDFIWLSQLHRPMINMPPRARHAWQLRAHYSLY